MELSELESRLVQDYTGGTMIDPVELTRIINLAVRRIDRMSLLEPNLGSVDLVAAAGSSDIVIPLNVRIIHTVSLVASSGELSFIDKKDYSMLMFAQNIETLPTDRLYWCYLNIHDTGADATFRREIKLFNMPAEGGTIRFVGVMWHPLLDEVTVLENRITKEHPEAVLKVAASLVERRYRNTTEADTLFNEARAELLEVHYDSIEEELEGLPSQMGG